MPPSSAKINSRAIPDPSGLLAVDDTLVALQTLATAVRKLWGKTAIGITGSMGKTTTKEAMAHLLSIRYRVHRTKGNFNNHFGLPLGLLTLEPEYDLAVIEMGMSHAGEIAALARIALPNEGVVTNVAPVHLEFFDSIAGIARAKYELIEALPHGGTAVLNADDEYVCQFGRDFKGKVVLFGLKPAADVRAENIEVARAPKARASISSAQGVRQPVHSPLLGTAQRLQRARRGRGRAGARHHALRDRRRPALARSPPTSADRSSNWVTSPCSTIATIPVRRR